MKPFFNRIKLSSTFIVKKACAWTATVYAVAGLVSLFVSFEGIFANDETFLCKFIVAAAILLGVWLACAFIIAFIVGIQRKKKVVEGQNGKAVYVLYGDLFDGLLKLKGKQFTHLIAVCPYRIE